MALSKADPITLGGAVLMVGTLAYSLGYMRGVRDKSRVMLRTQAEFAEAVVSAKLNGTLLSAEIQKRWGPATK